MIRLDPFRNQVSLCPFPACVHEATVEYFRGGITYSLPSMVWYAPLLGGFRLHTAGACVSSGRRLTVQPKSAAVMNMTTA
jgi:hypothetical protein